MMNLTNIPRSEVLLSQNEVAWRPRSITTARQDTQPDAPTPEIRAASSASSLLLSHLESKNLQPFPANVTASATCTDTTRHATAIACF
jgi:hypothetical protein